MLKGYGGMIFGRGSAGGVVSSDQQSRSSPTSARPALPWAATTRCGAASIWAKLNDTVAWRVERHGRGADSFRHDVDMKRYAINPTVTVLVSPATALTIGVEHLHDERTADRGIPARNGRPFVADAGTFFGNGPEQCQIDGGQRLRHPRPRFRRRPAAQNSLRVTHYDKFYQNVYPDNGNASSVRAPPAP